MKKILIVLTFACISTMAIAQRGGGDRFFEKVKAELNLTTAQTDELKELKIERQQVIEKMRADGIHPRDEAHRAFFETEREKTMAILTPEQRTKLEIISNERKLERSGTMEERKDTRQELNTYRTNEITPVLVKQRAKLDKKISRKDRKTIATIRILANKQRAEKRAAHDKRNAEHKTDKEDGQLSKNSRKGKRGPHHHKGKHHEHHIGHGLKEFQRKYPTEAAQLETLATKYESDITLLMEEIDNERAEWKAKRDNHKEDHKSKGCKSKENCKKGDSDKTDRKADHKAKREKRHSIEFLLLDPNTDVNAIENTANYNAINSVHKTNVFPNPATDNQTITFDVEKEGNVLVEIIDKKGKVVKQVHSGTMTKGNQSINVDVADLKGFVFYYRIIDASGTSSTKFMTKN